MHEHDVEPVLGILARPEHLDALVPHLEVEALVANVADAVQRQLGIALLQENGLDLKAVLERIFVVVDAAGELETTKVVDEARGSEEVESAKSSLLCNEKGRSEEKRGCKSNAEHSPLPFPADRRGCRGWRRWGVRR